MTAGGNAAAASEADIVVLAVKPGTVPKVVKEIREVLNEGRILISVAAALPIRAMPNIPVVVWEGAIGICHNAMGRKGRVFSGGGVTALSGSGPLYIYMVIDVMMAAGGRWG